VLGILTIVEICWVKEIITKQNPRRRQKKKKEYVIRSICYLILQKEEQKETYGHWFDFNDSSVEPIPAGRFIAYEGNNRQRK
jgi:hypothetical protein